MNPWTQSAGKLDALQNLADIQGALVQRASVLDCGDESAKSPLWLARRASLREPSPGSMPIQKRQLRRLRCRTPNASRILRDRRIARSVWSAWSLLPLFRVGFMCIFDLQLWTHIGVMSCLGTGWRQLLECGNGVGGVAALSWTGRGLGELRSCERCQSGDFADSVTAVQNLAANSTVQW